MKTLSVVWNKIKSFFISIGRICHKMFIWIGSLFKNYKILRVAYNKYDMEGNNIDHGIPIQEFYVKKFYKLTPKHILFKNFEGKKVELRSAAPMDYMVEDYN